MMKAFNAAFVAALILVSGAIDSRAAASAHDAVTPEDRQAFEAIIREYLLENPDIILDVLGILQERQRFAAAQQSRQQLADRRDALLNDPDSPVGGNPDGDVTVVEFFDYRCPYCRAVAPRLAQLLEEDDDIRFVYKEWPILGPVSEVAARAALASREQGLYEAFHEALMTHPQLTEEAIFKVAERVGLDEQRLKRDMEAPEIDDAITRTRALATALGITGTPAFVIGDRLVPGAVSLSDLKMLVKQARESG
jgi:protein-disulfide isomerase